NKVPVPSLSAAKGATLRYSFPVPAGASNLKISIAGGTGDADLYVKFGAPPTTASYDCRPYVGGNNETCTPTPIQAGTYHIMLNAYAAFSGITLTGSYDLTTNAAPTADFTFQTSAFTVTFQDASRDTDGTIASWQWYFGEKAQGSTARHPTFTYAAP